MYQLSTENVKIVSYAQGPFLTSQLLTQRLWQISTVTPDVPSSSSAGRSSEQHLKLFPDWSENRCSDLSMARLTGIVLTLTRSRARWEKTFAHIDDALLSRKVATIRTDAPLDINLDDAPNI